MSQRAQNGPRFNRRGKPAAYYWFLTTDLFDGAPHHIALTYEAVNSQAEIFLDGTPIGLRNFTDLPNGGGAPGSVAAGGVFVLGQRIEDVGTSDYFTAGQYFTGVIYEVRVYDDVRTQEEILIDMVTPLDADNLPVHLRNGWQFLTFGTGPTGEDITGSSDIFAIFR